MRIIIIGAGPGGYETALEAAGRGIEVVLIESGNVGGTCLNEGCIPTKTLYRSAEALAEARRAAEFGIVYGSNEAVVDFSRVMQRKQEVVAQLRGGVETLLHNKLITLVHGKATLTGAHSVVVHSTSALTPDEASGTAEEQAAESTEYTGDCIIIATGSVSASLPIPGADLPQVLSSGKMLDIDHVPERLCIIGAGVIGLEFASIFNSFGSKVTVLEYCKQILPRFDTDLAKRLKQSLSKSGIEIITSAAVQSISASAEGDGVQAEYALETRKGKEVKTVEADTVLMAVGRRPAVEGLGLEAAGVEYTPKGITVNDFMQTNVPSIYAIGDVNGRCMLAHAATYQGLKALNHICGEEDSINLSIVPSVVFTMPEAATVGLTEQDCEQQGIACRLLKSFFRSNGKAVSMGETDGFVKMIVAKEPADTDAGGKIPAGKILGCHLFGPHAADLIAEVTALIQCGATLADLKSLIHAHPTFSEVFHALS